MLKNKLKILMTSAEIAPFAKVGGLADVVGSLPPALKKLGVDVRLVMPLYGSIDKTKFKLRKLHSGIKISSAHKNEKINLWKSNLPNSNVIVYFIDAPKYFGFQDVYLKNDNAERFLFFSLASLCILITEKFKPNLIHCHDFHTALIPDLLKVLTGPNGDLILPKTCCQNPKLCCITESHNPQIFFKNIKTLFTIHNLNYQGKTDIETLKIGNLSKNSLKTLEKDAKDGDINFMAQGILNTNAINTVSPTYAKEIATSIYGANLDNIIKKRKKDLYGIVNGIDTNFFNPNTDEFIKENYSIKTINKKIENKLYLQKKLGLPADKNIALVSIVSRLAWQKGFELIDEKLCDLDCQFVILGTGQEKYEKQLKKLSKKYPKKFSAKIDFNIELAQQIYAGSDIFLMPSRFEPCGLGQMIAMRYGTIPLVRKTGGLADTVNNSVGFSFDGFSSADLYQTLNKSLDVYYKKPKKWRSLQKKSMKKDFSWNKSAKEYLKLYKKTIAREV
ncbi:MAG: glycogen/starch synthase [Candidatus Falkowbacteria bacterium]